MTLSRAELLELVQIMPELTFSYSVDSQWLKTEAVQAYLNFYQINFENEIPELIHGFGCVKTKKFNIATHYWVPSQAKGTLLIVHGYYDHVGVFDNAIAFALKNNFAVLAFDLPGHGLSTGEAAVIDSFNEYGDVLAEIIHKSNAHLPQPLFALGQSTGCAAIMNYLWRYPPSDNQPPVFSKLALCSPLILARGWRGVQLGWLVYAILKYFVSQIKRGPANSSHDQEFNQFLIHNDSLQAKYLSLRWVGAMRQWHKMFCTFVPMQQKIVIVQGTGDMTVDWRYNIPLVNKKFPNAEIVYVEAAKHQLVNESPLYRNKVFSTLEQYFFHS